YSPLLEALYTGGNCGPIGDEEIDIRCWTQQPLGCDTDFGVIRDDYFPLRVARQMAQEISLVRICAGKPLFDVDSIHANKHNVCKQHIGGGGGQRTDQGEPVSAKMTAG